MAEFSINIVDDGTGFNELEIAGENLVAGNLCYLGTDNKYYKTSALSKTSSTTELRIALNSIPINTKGLFLKRGKFTKSGLTAGAKYYVSETFGEFTNIQPNTISSNVIRYVGTAWDNEVLEFNDDATYILADGSEANEVTIAGVGGSGHIIQEESSSLVARTNLNFIGTGVTATDNPGTSSTDITIIDSAAHIHNNFALLQTYTQTNADITYAVDNAHTIYSLGSKTVDETGLVNGDVLSFNSTSGNLEYIPQSNGVTDHTLLTNIGSNTHAQIDTHIADNTIHFTQGAIQIAESQVTNLVGKYELDLGLPASDGYVLTSTTAGVRSWNNISGGAPEADTLNSVTSRGNSTSNSISTGAITSSGQIISTKFTSAGEVILEASSGSNSSIKTTNSTNIYIDSNNNSTSQKFSVLSNVSTYSAPNEVFYVNETGRIVSIIDGTSQNWKAGYTHSLLTSGNPHQVYGAEVALTGYALPGSTSSVLPTDSTNVAIGKLEKSIEDINTSGPMTSFIIKEGNGTETSTVTNGETIHFAQGAGIQVEMTSTTSGGTLTFTNTDPNVNLIHTGEVFGAEALTISSNVVDLDNLIVGGTTGVTKYLRYDSAGSGLIWDVPPDTNTDTNTWRPVTLSGGTPLGGAETLTLKSGDGVSITEATGTFTFNTNNYWKLETDSVFKQNISHKEAVSFDSGTGINVTSTTVANPNVTFSLADNGINALQLNVTGNGTTSQYLRSDGDGTFTWAIPPDNDTIYSGWSARTNGIPRKTVTSGDYLNFKNGTGINISYSSSDITFNVSDNYLKNNANDTTTGTLTASAFYESSLRSLKENIKPFKEDATKLINKLDIVSFDKKDKSVTDKIGIIIDESPKEFANKEQTKVDLYNTIFVQAKAIQELSIRLKILENKLLTI